MKMLDKMPYCFTKEDVIFNFTNKFQFDNWLKTKIRNLMQFQILLTYNYKNDGEV